MITDIKVVASKRYGTLSPLRYPGGKAALAGLFADVIREVDIQHCTYVEPYAGGAGAGIALLREGLVERLVINDIDPAVHAFWNAVTTDNDAFVDWVQNVPLTVDEWRLQRDIYRDPTNAPDILGRAFFYLNRTNRSGVLRAGVIGGLAQEGNYKIDARFNRETLTSRLRAIGDVAAAIEVTALDGRTIIAQHGNRPNSFMYIDPPYVKAGGRLYLNAFEARDHQALAAAVDQIAGAHWLMTYDNSPWIAKLYASHMQATLDLTYSARHPGKATELLVASPEVAAALSTITVDTEPAAG
jgi:DNA adenine methylase